MHFSRFTISKFLWKQHEASPAIAIFLDAFQKSCFRDSHRFRRRVNKRKYQSNKQDGVDVQKNNTRARAFAEANKKISFLLFARFRQPGSAGEQIASPGF